MKKKLMTREEIFIWLLTEDIKDTVARAVDREIMKELEK